MPGKVAVILNPASGGAKRGEGAERHRAIRAVLSSHGVRVLWYETSTEDPGCSSARLAVRQGADALLVSGGDGTVMACVSALVGTEVPLAIVPNGTGNIIAASLRLPAGVVEATEVALHGARQWIDVGVSGSDRAFFAT